MMAHHKEMNLLKTKHRADVEKETSDILNGNRNLASPEVNVDGMSNEVQELPLVWKLEIVWQRYGQNVYPTSEAVGEQRTI